MGLFQLRSLPGVAWPPLPPPMLAPIWSAYLSLDRTQWLSPAEIEAGQLAQLRTLLDHCYNQVPYYRRVMDTVGVRPDEVRTLADFRRLPLLTRELYQTHADDLKARQLPPGMTESESSYTSGTSGVPIKVLKTNRVALWWQALLLRDMEWSGLDPRRTVATLRLLAFTPDKLPNALAGFRQNAWTDVLGRLFECGPLYGMDVRQDPRRQLEWLREVRADYLLSLPSNLECLAGLIVESGRPLDGLQAIQAVGEPLSAESRRIIEAGFGVPVKNLYSTSEAGYMASPCPTGAGLHVHAENVIVEVLDAEGRPCGPGETGRLVFTTLHNFLGPFVRYDILDNVTLADGPCDCGRGLPLWKHVDGRRMPMLHLPDGRRKSSQGIVLRIRQIGGFHQFQYVQKTPDHSLVRVIPDGSWNIDRAEEIRAMVRDEFGHPVRVDIEEYETIPRPPGGKLKFVVIEPDQPRPPERP